MLTAQEFVASIKCQWPGGRMQKAIAASHQTLVGTTQMRC